MKKKKGRSEKKERKKMAETRQAASRDESLE